MKEFTLKKVLQNGEVISENSLSINENDILIMQPTIEMRNDTVLKIHEHVYKALQDSETKLITVPYGFEFKVLSIK